MTSKNKKKVKFYDPQIDFKKESINKRLQFIESTSFPMPSEIEISESGVCNMNLYQRNCIKNYVMS